MAQSTLAAFHAPFLTAAGVPYEHAFCLGEPCVFYCGSSPGALTHVNFIAANYCTVSCQSFEIPRLQAQKYLLHLSLGEMEREVHGGALSAAERILWRRWVNDVGGPQKKSRLCCAGCWVRKLTFELEPDASGTMYCSSCWALPCSAQEKTLPPWRLASSSVETVPASSDESALPSPTGVEASKISKGVLSHWDAAVGVGYATFGDLQGVLASEPYSLKQSFFKHFQIVNAHLILV